MQPCADRIEDRGVKFQQLLGNHCLLVDVVDICQVAAEGGCLHLVPALVALQLMWLSGRLMLLVAEVQGSIPCKTPRLE